ncbi:MAG: bifunctional homocysteine S-methyltransferase/methylenetetrahydrofolate reductase [Ktedonobacterales bacterium]|nr:bifunctional homocysteine S-methyltransferase/methylenetetrahydrofolate reductase [Ktedonobacterales bacterium]
MSEPVLERLRQGPLLCDGAMGTMLYARAAEPLTHGRCFDELVLTQPGLVQAIHRDYIQAGAQIIETNTFGANATKLAAYGLADRVRAINFRAAKLALEACELAGRQTFVAGAVGPSGQLPLPTAENDEPRLSALRALFREQMEALIEGGVDLLILETFSNLAELRQAVLAAREAGNLPLVAQMTFSEDGLTLSGETPASVALALEAMRVDVIGSNCSVGPAGIEDTLSEMAGALGTRGEHPLLSAQPNAGLPARVENRFLYVSTPSYFAAFTRRMAQSGVRLIGGCCGTTPAHIAAMREALADELPVAAPHVWPTVSISASPIAPTQSAEDTELMAGMPTTLLRQELEAGRFVVSIELDPPKGLNPGKIIDGAAYLKSLGVRFINIADSPMARVRMSCLALARLLRDQLDLESTVHFTTRDRNLMAIQSDLLGAHALGIHNILALTGDPVRVGNYPNLTGVWDVDSVGLIRILHGMNAGQDAGGAALGMQAKFHIGAALNLNMVDTPIDVANERARRKLLEDEHSDAEERAEHLHPHLTETELELHRLRHKLEAGAQYIMTQPIYDLAPLEEFAQRFGPLPVPMILGMIPLHSSRHAEYLHNEVPGIIIPHVVRARMREAGERGREVGIDLAHEVITEARARGLIQGCYLMPSYGRYDLVGELARELLRAAPAVTSRDARP